MHTISRTRVNECISPLLLTTDASELVAASLECCLGAGRGGPPPPPPTAMDGAEGFFTKGLWRGGRLAGGGEGRRFGRGS